MLTFRASHENVDLELELCVHITGYLLPISRSFSKADNLYSSCRTTYYNTPLVHWTHGCHKRRVDMKALARYQLILLGKQRHIGVNNLPKVVARQCSGRELNPRSANCESGALTTTPPSHTCIISYHIIDVKRQNHLKVGTDKPKLNVKMQSVSDDEKTC